MRVVCHGLVQTALNVIARRSSPLLTHHFNVGLLIRFHVLNVHRLQPLSLHALFQLLVCRVQLRKEGIEAG